jgi:hypothetical protein
MSGVTGASRVKSRRDFNQFFASYLNVVGLFPGVVNVRTAGSYNSDIDKEDFGDIDLIILVNSDSDKHKIKKEMQAFFTALPESMIVPFTSVKHSGKRTYNAGELVTVRYHDPDLEYSVQIDNIVALSEQEANFKQEFLNMPAEKQGLILGLVKVAAIETHPALLFKKLSKESLPHLLPNQEYEFNLSSVELQLRKVTYQKDTFVQVSREVVWSSQNFKDLRSLLYQYDIDKDFLELLVDCVSTVKNPRSNKRIQGVFGSMVSVKSGEVGTPKGEGKIKSLTQVKELLV